MNSSISPRESYLGLHFPLGSIINICSRLNLMVLLIVPLSARFGLMGMDVMNESSRMKLIFADRDLTYLCLWLELPPSHEDTLRLGEIKTNQAEDIMSPFYWFSLE